MVVSLVVDNSPSLAVARNTYVPGTENIALLMALPLLTRIGSIFSKVTLPGPRYCIQVTFKPSLVGMFVFVWALPGSAAGVAFGARGLGKPSSVTMAVSLTGLPTAVGPAGSIVQRLFDRACDQRAVRNH